ncbi:S1 family peptidase [Oligoflexaceae bacterium]|nr:S1 family peptidase [Oligoflexaceae bacterium]
MNLIVRAISIASVISMISCGQELLQRRTSQTTPESNINLQLINASVADLKDFPASVIADSNGSACTATIVGPKVLMIASHCIKHDAPVIFKADNKSYSGTCSQSSLYRQGVDHDLAFCRLDKKVENVPYEVVNIDPDLVQVGSKLLLSGFGCRKSGGIGGADGQYRIGETQVSRLPNRLSYDIMTENGGALCYGDSGGPAFLYTDDQKLNRVVVSVNSKGNMSNESYLTSTSSDASIKFIKGWSGYFQLKICGVHKGVEGCRADSAAELSVACESLTDSDFDSWKSCLNSAIVETKCTAVRKKINACVYSKAW